jgi:glycosyltransferase involved in cell wall biosynthesis
MRSSGSKSRVLFIGKRFYTNRDALEERYGRIFQLPQFWSASGIRTRLWLVDYHSRQRIDRREGHLSIESLPLRSFDTLGKLFSHLLLGKALTHIVASGDCYIGLLGYSIAKRTGAQFIFDVYDKYDEFGGYRELLGFSPFPFLLKRADRCLFASQALLEQHGQKERGDIKVVNGLDRDRFKPLDMQACRQERHLPADTPLIGYFGGMEPDRGVADLIKAVSQLREQGLPIELLLGGKIAPPLEVNVPGVRYLGDIPFQEMPQLLAACDLLAVPYRRSALMDAGSSNKIAEALACRKPIVATRTPNLVANFAEASRILEGRLAVPGDVGSIATVIRAQLEAPILAPLPGGWDWESIANEAAHQLQLEFNDSVRPH